MKRIWLVLLAGGVLLSAGCTRQAGAPTVVVVAPTETAVLEPPALEPTATLEAVETTAPGAEETPPPTTTPFPVGPVSQPCMETVPGMVLQNSLYSDLPESALAFLNAGGGTADLEAGLLAQGMGNTPVSAQQADLTGDGWLDVVVSVINPDSVLMFPEGVLLVYACQGGQYELIYQQESADFASAPAIIHIRDLNMDQLDELIVSSSTCGAHTCFEDIQILSWTGEGIENLLDGTTEDIPFPNVQLTDYDNDRVYQLEVVGEGFGSVGAGPQREMTRVWTYSPERGLWALTDERIGASDYRIHRLHDADDAMARGEYMVALLLYDQVFNDPNLLDWGDPVTEQLNIGGYARYKMVVAYALSGDLATAQEFLRQMATVFPAGLPQVDYVELAQVFLAAFEEGGQEAGCAAAQAYAAEHPVTVLEPLGPVFFGYGNREYMPEDVCP